MIKKLAVAAMVALFALAPVAALAQLSTGSEFATHTPGQSVPGVVMMCLDANNLAVPVSSGLCANGGGASSATSPSFSQQVGTQNLNVNQVSVGATATLIHAVTAARQAITIENTGSVAIDCGPTNAVTASTGWPVSATNGTVTWNYQGAVYCILSTGVTPSVASYSETY